VLQTVNHSSPATLLVLGSKPEPRLPDPGAFDALACANASGRSAKDHGLAAPLFTVMTAVVASGNASDEHSLKAVRGLRTGTLYYLPRPKTERSRGLESLHKRAKEWRMSAWNLKRRLRTLDYTFEHFIAWRAARYHQLICDLCGKDPDIEAVIAQKQPSTGLMTLAVGMSLGRFGRFIMAGFDLTLTHAYGTNPLIEARGTALSGHASTDAAVLAHLSSRHGTIFTTEPALQAVTGVPFWGARNDEKGPVA